jgi:peroxiredoxin
MVQTESYKLPMGTAAPDFSLPGVDGKTHTPETLRGPKGLLIIFFCNHCPYAVAVQQRVLAIARDFMPRGMGMALISSNDVTTHPDDSFDKMKELAASLGLPCAYLYDETQEVAKAYRATCTPDPFLFDADLQLHYHGRIDDGGRDASKATTHELRDAIEGMLSGAPAPEKQWNSLGCNIKWKGGVFPDYSQG